MSRFITMDKLPRNATPLPAHEYLELNSLTAFTFSQTFGVSFPVSVAMANASVKEQTGGSPFCHPPSPDEHCRR